MIRHSDHLEHTPAMALALEGQIELITELGYPPRALVQDSHRVIWTEDKRGKASACIVYEEDKDGSRKRFWVWLSYTRPYQRKKGLHDKLWRALERRARATGVEIISGGIKSDNKPMIAAARSNGREIAYCVFQKVVGKTPKRRKAP